MEWEVVLRYLVVLGVLTGIGAPLAALAFERFPSKGATFALPTALLPITLITIWVGQVAFGHWTLLLAIFLVGSASLVAYHHGAKPDWDAVVRAFGIFLVGFAFLMFVRASNPAVTPQGGEQFLHFAITKSIERAAQLPPEDMWFAGEPLRYYYGGQLQVSGLSMLSNVELRYGFNLGIATFYGILFAAAYGLVGAVTANTGYSQRFGGILGIIFVAWGGATTTAIRFLIARLPEDLATTLGGPAFGFAASRFGIPLAEFIAQQGNLGSWDWWYTRYVVPGTLQEFPLYSFVKADLHGHALTTGYILVAAALAFAYYQTPAHQQWRRYGLLFGAMGVVTGVFGVMNTWSVPTAVGLAWLSVAASKAHPVSLYPNWLAIRLRKVPSEGNSGLTWFTDQVWRVVLAIPPAVGVGIIGIILASPFLAFGNVPQNGGVGFLPPRSPLLPFLVVYGGLLTTVLSLLVWRSHLLLGNEGVHQRALSLLTITALAIPMLFVAPVLAVLGPVGLIVWWLIRTERLGYTGILIVAGLGLLGSMEIIHAVVWPPELDRWNTTLKVAIQGWTLGAAGVGAATAMVLHAGVNRLRNPNENAEVVKTPLPAVPSFNRWSAAALAVALAILVILATLPFPLLVSAETVGAQVRDGDKFSLNAIEPNEPWHGEELAAIKWLDERNGRPVIVERPGWETYQWTNPASTFTGLPTVAGWAHERGYRGIETYERRTAKADSIYEGPWAEAVSVLQQFDVQFIYIGPNEREGYSDLSERFADRAELTEAFSNDAVTIYQVDLDD